MTDLPSFADVNVRNGYNDLKSDLRWVLDFSGQFWNWPALSAITAPTISKLLAIHQQVQMTTDVAGSVCEFGTYILTKLKVIRHVLELSEKKRGGLFGFDHFKGYSRSSSPLGNEFDDNFPKIFEIQHPELVRESLAKFNAAAEVIYGISQHISLIEGELPSSYEQLSSTIESISLCYFDLQDAEVMSKLVPLVLKKCNKGALIVFEGYNLDFFPKTTLYINSFIEETKSVRVLELERSIPFSKVLQVLD